MAFVFWLFWVIDLLLCIIAIVGKGFADSFHSSGSVPWLTLLLVGCTAGSFILRVFMKKAVWAMGVVALPLLILLVLYFIDKAQEP